MCAEHSAHCILKACTKIFYTAFSLFSENIIKYLKTIKIHQKIYDYGNIFIIKIIFRFFSGKN